MKSFIPEETVSERFDVEETRRLMGVANLYGDDAEVAAFSRTALPAALDRIEEQQKEIERLREIERRAVEFEMTVMDADLLHFPLENVIAFTNLRNALLAAPDTLAFVEKTILGSTRQPDCAVRSPKVQPEPFPPDAEC